MVRLSWLTRIRDSDAAIRKTDSSSRRCSPAAWALRKSMRGSRLRVAETMIRLRSLSAWNRMFNAWPILPDHRLASGLKTVVKLGAAFAQMRDCAIKLFFPFANVGIDL